jgi:aminoglycoside phosphotransferase (APT) family kinase protein
MALSGDATALLAAVPPALATQLRLGDATAATLLGGLTNRGACFVTPAGRFAVRLAWPDPGGAVDHEAAAAAARWAGAAGIGAELLFADPARGLTVARWLDGEQASPALLATRAMAAGTLLRQVHGATPGWGRSVDYAALLAGYAEQAGPAAALPPAQVTVLDSAVDALASSELAPVPSHGDPVPANWLVAPQGLRLIDWDYAARHDPAWDLAWLAREAGFDPAAEAALLAGSAHPFMDAGRLSVLRLLVARVGVLWGTTRAQQPGLPDAGAWTADCRAEFEARIADQALPDRVAALR